VPTQIVPDAQFITEPPIFVSLVWYACCDVMARAARVRLLAAAAVDVDRRRFYVTGSWLHFKGLEIRERADAGRVVQQRHLELRQQQQPRRNNFYENLNIHNITGPGLSIAHNGNGVGGGHLILNVRFARQLRPELQPGRTARTPTDSATTIRRAARPRPIGAAAPGGTPTTASTSISQEVPVIIENCWAMQNGYPIRGRASVVGERNGFKMGSSQTASATSSGQTWRGRTTRRASTPTIRRAATTGTTTRRT
jgi:hypothetical protein